MANPLANILRKPAETLANEWARMAPRERKLVVIFIATFFVAVVSVGTFLFVGHLGEIEDENDEIRDALEAIADNRAEYLSAKARMRAQEIRIGTRAPQLATDLEAAARQIGIQIPETNERQPKPVGRRYLEHNVDVKLRQVDLQQLGRFLNKLETGPHLIYVTRLGLRRRFAERDKLDVEITATGLERLPEGRTNDQGEGRSGT